MYAVKYLRKLHNTIINCKKTQSFKKGPLKWAQRGLQEQDQVLGSRSPHKDKGLQIVSLLYTKNK